MTSNKKNRRKDFTLIGAMKNVERKFVLKDKGGFQMNVKTLPECYSILKSDKTTTLLLHALHHLLRFLIGSLCCLHLL